MAQAPQYGPEGRDWYHPTEFEPGAEQAAIPAAGFDLGRYETRRGRDTQLRRTALLARLRRRRIDDNG